MLGQCMHVAAIFRLSNSVSCAGFARYTANKLGALSKLDAVPPVMARGEPATFYGDGNMPCAVPYGADLQAPEPCSAAAGLQALQSPCLLARGHTEGS